MTQHSDQPSNPKRRQLIQSAAAAFGVAALHAPAADAAGSHAAPAAGASAPAAASDTVDVVVVGAGLSGLTAARELLRKGHSVAVLEGRDRVGGRTWTIPVGTRRYDIGGQFVGPSQDRIRALVTEFGLRLQPVYSDAKHIWELPGQRIEFTGTVPSLSLIAKIDLGRLIDKMNQIAQAVGTTAPWAAPDAAALDAMTLAQWVREHSFSESTRHFATIMTRAVLGADPDEISVLYWAYYVAQGDSIEMLISGAGGAQDSVIEGGSQQLSLRMAQELGAAVRLTQPARRVVQAADGVDVYTDTARIHARYAILALPPAMAAGIAFEPSLAGDRRELQSRAPMGRYAKVVLTYDKPFWREHGYAGDVASLQGPVVATYDDASLEGSALLGFIGGDSERAWRSLSAEARKAAVLDCFARWFGPEALKPVAYAEKDWTIDDWTNGAPATILPPGVLSRLGPALRQPIGRIHWAGTETALRWTGYMDGAIRAGEQTAKDVLGLLSS
ncbi:MAG: FAD-dependent oxidoreductase [Nevskia sp.]|nr:FAD-dependent oxidoreductase [Nevskia sp.]